MIRGIRSQVACYAVTLGVVIGSLVQAQSPATLNVDRSSFLYTNCFGYLPDPQRNVGCGCCGGIPQPRYDGMTQFVAAQQLAAQRLAIQPRTHRPQAAKKHRLSCNGQTFFVYGR
jgi:hypothetical protein